MQFVILCHDKPGSLELRHQTRATHLDFIKENTIHVLAAGPFVDEHDQMIGSMLIVTFESEAKVKEFVANDPYTKAGLFENVEIRRWRWSIKPPVA